MKKKFETIIKRLISNGDTEPLTGIDIAEQFRPDETTPEATFRNLNAAFLISLCGGSHPLNFEAKHFIEDLKKQHHWKEAADFYCTCMSLIIEEIEERITAIEAMVSALKERFSDEAVYKNPAQLAVLQREFDEQSAELELLYRAYEYRGG